jgi:hypothetical protein
MVHVRRHHAALLLLLTCGLSAGEAGPSKTEIKQWDEARQVREALEKQVAQTPADKRGPLITQLEGLRRQYAQHAALPYVLVELGKLYEETKPEQALACYQQAAKFPLKTDRFGTGQQLGWRATAALLEKQGKHREALDAVGNLSVSETGGGVTEAEKEIARCRLRMQLMAPEEALKAFWRDLENGKPRRSPDLPVRLCMLYGRERQEDLAKEIATRLEMYPVPPDEKATAEARDYYEVLMGTKAHMEFVKELREAKSEKLVALLNATAQDDPGNLNGRPDRLFDRRDPALEFELWRERALLESCVAKKDEVVWLLLKAAEDHPGALLACTLGKLATPEAVACLKQRAQAEQEPLGLRNWYYALLLTSDKSVEAFLVKEAQTKPKAAEALKWAVEARKQTQ